MSQQPPLDPQIPQQGPQGQYPQGNYPPPQGYSQYPQQPVSTPPKKKRSKLLIGVVVVVVLGLCGIVGNSLIHTAGATTASTITQSSTANSATQVPTKTSATGNWTTTHSYIGNGIKKTESFVVGNSWKIVWTCKGIDVGGTQADGSLSITVDGSDNTPIDIASGTCKAGQTTKDSTEEHTGGNVYLNIIGTSDWTVKVQELK